MKPLLKWAGGKTQLLKKIKESMPNNYNVYCEPFFGSGAVFFDIQPSNAIISDTNPQLINLYNNIKHHPKSLINHINLIFNEFNLSEDKASFYFEKRETFNRMIRNNSVDTSALLVFLNKTCFNGLYRTNSNGLFNVPFSKKTYVNAPVDNINSLSKALQNVDIRNEDFEIICKNLKKNDFVYFDPPYYNTFDEYQANGFNEKEQIRLFKLFKKLTNKGVKCMLSNSNEDFIKSLYEDYHIEILDVRRNINRKGNERKSKEVLITNYLGENSNIHE